MLSARPELLSDDHARWIVDPASGTFVGLPGPLVRRRILYALPLDDLGGYRRYGVPKPVAEDAEFWFDFSRIIPKGVGIASATVVITTNTVPPLPATGLVAGPVQIDDRAVYATFTGGQDGIDHQVTWTATDTQGNIWPRTVLLLSANTT